MIFSPPRHKDTKKHFLHFVIRRSSFVILFIFAFRISPFAFADGTIDVNINPATGYAISASGSYRVVSDVTMNSGVEAVAISVNDVTIDLNGHTLTGGGGVSANGISGGTRTNLTVMGGTIVGFSNNGIYLGGRAHVHDLTVRGCSAAGIYVGADSIVERCRSLDNNTGGANAGIWIGQDSVAKDCVASSNIPSGSAATYGIFVNGTGCRAEGNVCENNTSPGGTAFGIYCSGTDNHLVHNVCRGNRSTSGTGDSIGIYSNDSAVIRNNVCANNTSAGGKSFGIQAGLANVMEDNVCSNNTSGGVYAATGISTGNGCTIRNNTCWGNSSNDSGSAYGIFTGLSCTIEGNTCYSNNEGPNASAYASGIYADSFSIILHNTCSYNNATGANGNAYGIYAKTGCLIRGNACNAQAAAGTGIAVGIEAYNEDRVVENQCGGNGGGTHGWGIQVTSIGTLIAGNSLNGNGTAGLVFTTGTNNRSENNRFHQTTAIDLVNGVAPASSGAGDLADVTY